MPDTDQKIKMFTESAERRLQDLQRENKNDLASIHKGITAITGDIGAIRADVANTKLEVVAIKSDIKNLATKTQLVETIGTVKDWCVEKMQDDMDRHKAEKHKSLPPMANGNKAMIKIITALVGGIVALAGCLTAIVKYMD